MLPHLFSPQYIAMRQLRSGIVPPRPIYPPVLSNVTERTPPRQTDNKAQQHTPHRQANIGKTRDDSIEGKGTAKPVLNVAASPFIPLQVCGDSNNRYPHLLIPRNMKKFYSSKVDCNTTIPISCNIFAVFLQKVATSNVKFCKTLVEHWIKVREIACAKPRLDQHLQF